MNIGFNFEVSFVDIGFEFFPRANSIGDVKFKSRSQQTYNFKFLFKKFFNIAYKIEYISLKDIRSLNVSIWNAVTALSQLKLFVYSHFPYDNANL